MPTSTEVAIATTTLGSASEFITFSSISAAYTDLRVVLVVKNFTSSTSSVNIGLVFNGDTGSNGSTTRLIGDGSTATSNNTTGNTAMCRLQTQASTSLPVFLTWDIFSYAGSTFKTALGESSSDLNGSGQVSRSVGLWRSTSAITSVELSGPEMAIGTTATLYGIL
jgi:hypothetical protein